MDKREKEVIRFRVIQCDTLATHPQNILYSTCPHSLNVSSTMAT